MGVKHRVKYLLNLIAFSVVMNHKSNSRCARTINPMLKGCVANVANIPTSRKTTCKQNVQEKGKLKKIMAVRILSRQCFRSLTAVTTRSKLKLLAPALYKVSSVFISCCKYY